MSDKGMPESVLVGDDHMQVRAGMVKLLKSANAALVWTRIEYRVKHVAYSHEKDGRLWWEVKADELGEDVGLSADQVDRAVTKLVDGGYLLAEQHSFPLPTRSFSPVVAPSAESRKGPGTGRDTAESTPRNRGGQPAKSRTAPSIEEREDIEEEARADGSVYSPELRAVAERIAVMVRANGFKVATVGVNWWQPVERLMRLDGYELEQIEIVARWATSDEFWLKNIRSTSKLRKHFARLRLDRNQDLAKRKNAPASRAASVIEMGQRLARGEQKSVGA